jgi:hypothetical protein
MRSMRSPTGFNYAGKGAARNISHGSEEKQLGDKKREI